MIEPWWSGIPEVQLPVECAGGAHHLSWSDGVLRALDHPDAERERALAALGADPYPCLDLVGLWHDHDDDLDVLLLGSRGPSDQLHTPEDDGSGVGMSRRGGQAGWTSYAPLPRHGGKGGGWWSLGSLPTDQPEGVERLLRLGGGLPDRLTATVVATWAQRLADPDPRVVAAFPALRTALYGRVATALRTWFGDPVLVVEVTIGDEPELVRDAGSVQVTLPFTWLSDVWARGFATLFDRFCLAVERSGPDQWVLLTCDRDLGAPRRVTVSF